MKRSPIRRVSEARKAAAAKAGSTFTQARGLQTIALRKEIPGAAEGETAPPLSRRHPIKSVSTKRARANRQRSRLIRELFGDKPIRCARPGCPRWADDVHEILPRARTGGLITDPSIWAPLCRHDNEEATREDRNQWAYDAGLMFHSGQLEEARAAGLVAAWRTADGRILREAPAGGEAA